MTEEAIARKPNPAGSWSGAATARIAVIVILTLAAVSANVLGPMMFEDVDDDLVFLAFLSAGGLVAQVCLLAIWAALASQSAVLRLTITVGLLAIVCCGFIVGLRIIDPRLPTEVVVVVFGAGLALYCGMQVPLWIMRGMWQQRIDTSEGLALSSEQESAQFGLRHLLIATGFISVVIVVIKYSLPPTRFGPMPPWGQIVAAVLAFAVFTTLVAIPCIWVALGRRNRLPWLIWLIVACGAGPPALIGVLTGVFGSSPPAEVFLAFYSFGFGAAAITLFGLLSMRLVGYRLRETAEKEEAVNHAAEALPGESPHKAPCE